jgi:phenylpropionate dioxygenase-like ring-hydroxylating dioxygenase large terminal subunit
MTKSLALDTFSPGIYALPEARAWPQDLKSPPLHSVSPGSEAWLQVDPACFTDPAFLPREQAGLWRRSWLCAGRASDIPKAGDWLRFDLAGQSYLLIRGADGQVRAFFNVCQHRGNPLVTDDFGHASRLVCGYHAWVYDQLGRCTRVTDRRWFDDGALAGSVDLAPVRCQSWAGFLFITENPEAPDLVDGLGEVPALMAAFGMENMHVVSDVVVRMNANWKTVLHANLEAYHFQAVHPEALPYADDLLQQIDFYPGGHSRFITPTGQPSSRLKPRAQVTPEQKALLAELAVDPAGLSPHEVRAALQQAKRRPDNPFGLDYSACSDSQLSDDWSLTLFPNMTLNAHPEGVLFMRYLPDAKDPEVCDFHVMVLCPQMKPGARPPSYMGVPAEADLSGASRPQRQYRTMAEPMLGWALDQDVAILADMQMGLRSRGLRAIRLSQMEQRIQHFFANYGPAIGLDPLTP